MKHILLVVFLLFASAATQAQGVLAEAPFKKANIIVIQTTDSALVAYRNIGRLLLSQGYTIANSDKDFGSITTAQKSGPRMLKHSVTAVVTPGKAGSQVALSGSFSDGVPSAVLGATATMNLDIENRGAKGSAFQLSWETLDKVAHAYPGGKVAYSAR